MSVLAPTSFPQFLERRRQYGSGCVYRTSYPGEEETIFFKGGCVYSITYPREEEAVWRWACLFYKISWWGEGGTEVSVPIPPPILEAVLRCM
jgi:hypothetical protein